MNEAIGRSPPSRGASPSRMSAPSIEEESGILFGHLCLATEARCNLQALLLA